MAHSLVYIPRYPSKTHGHVSVKTPRSLKRLQTIVKSNIEHNESECVHILQPKAIESTNFSDYGQASFTVFVRFSTSNFIS